MEKNANPIEFLCDNLYSVCINVLIVSVQLASKLSYSHKHIDKLFKKCGERGQKISNVRFHKEKLTTMVQFITQSCMLFVVFCSAFMANLVHNSSGVNPIQFWRTFTNQFSIVNDIVVTQSLPPFFIRHFRYILSHTQWSGNSIWIGELIFASFSSP